MAKKFSMSANTYIQNKIRFQIKNIENFRWTYDEACREAISITVNNILRILFPDPNSQCSITISEYVYMTSDNVYIMTLYDNNTILYQFSDLDKPNDPMVTGDYIKHIVKKLIDFIMYTDSIKSINWDYDKFFL